MARVKFLVFAVVVLGLWLTHLLIVSPAFYARALDFAKSEQRAAMTASSARLREQQLLLQSLMAKVSSSPLLAASLNRTKPEPPDLEKLAVVRTLVAKDAPEGLQRPLIVGIVNESGALFSRGEEVVNAQAAGLEGSALSQAGNAGLVQPAFKTPHLFYAFWVRGPAQAGEEGKPLAAIVIGAPRMSVAGLERLLQETGASAIGLVHLGKVVESVGPEQALLEQAEQKIQPNHISVLSRGTVGRFLFLKLPIALGTGSSATKGKAALAVAARSVLDSSTEIVSVYSLKPTLSWLARYQLAALCVWLGLALLSVLGFFWIGRDAQGHEHDRFERAPTEPSLAESSAPYANASFPPPPPSPPEFSDQAPPFALSPEPSTVRAELDQYPPPPSSEPDGSESAQPSGQVGSFEQAEGQGSFGEEEQFSDEDKTRVYDYEPSNNGVLHASPAHEAPPESGEEPVDATRVASVPDELLQASAYPPPPPLAAESEFQEVSSEAASGPTLDPDEQHIHDTYREFVATRERCGELGDGIGYDKFSLKLRKNREQLIEKYSCRSVRFQVYVKDGKAALKATPLKD